MLREQPAFVAWAVTAIVLVAKMHLISLAQVVYRVRTNNWRVAEDAAKFGKSGATAVADTGVGERANNAWRNDLENIPGFLILGLAYVLAGAPSAWAIGLFATFVAGRFAHTLFYLAQRQPHRTLSYYVGQIAQVGVVVHLIVLLLH
jgi:uncharacterized MAPEG superfamily protein